MYTNAYDLMKAVRARKAADALKRQQAQENEAQAEKVEAQVTIFEEEKVEDKVEKKEESEKKPSKKQSNKIRRAQERDFLVEDAEQPAIPDDEQQFIF